MFRREILVRTLAAVEHAYIRIEYKVGIKVNLPIDRTKIMLNQFWYLRPGRKNVNAAWKLSDISRTNVYVGIERTWKEA